MTKIYFYEAFFQIRTFISLNIEFFFSLKNKWNAPTVALASKFLKWTVPFFDAASIWTPFNKSPHTFPNRTVMHYVIKFTGVVALFALLTVSYSRANIFKQISVFKEDRFCSTFLNFLKTEDSSLVFCYNRRKCLWTSFLNGKAILFLSLQHIIKHIAENVCEVPSAFQPFPYRIYAPFSQK